MNQEMSWDVDGDLAEIAAQVEETYYSLDQSRLESCPAELRARCWNRLTPGAWDEDAAKILMFVARVPWDDRRDVNAAMDLKRLFESAFQVGSSLVPKIVHALTIQTERPMKLMMEQRGVSEELLDANPMRAVEECFFGPKEPPENFLTGGLILTTYRSVALDSEPTGFLAAIFAIREAFAYFHGRQPEAARACVRWAKPTLVTLEPDLDRPQAEAVGQCLSATADAAEDAGEFDDCLSLWEEALRFLPPRGDERAECHFCIGREFERRGRLEEAMRAYQAALDTPGVRDADLPKLVRMSLSTIRAQLESDPGKLVIDRGIAGKFGGSEEFAEVIPRVIRQLDRGQRVPDAELLRAISAIRQWVCWREDQGMRDGECLSMFLVALKMCLSLEDQTQLPISYTELLAQGDRYLDAGGEADRLQFRTLREHVLGRDRTR